MTLLEAGTSLEGKYEILDRLEGGGMGEVYRVRHVHLQELRVIKLLRRDLAQDPTAAQRFHREARTATQVKHPHVATLYDYSRLPDGRFYMVWEYISGEDVSSFLKRRGPMYLPHGLDLGIQTLRGLEALHAAQVIHRDISPDNLMITTDRRGNPWIKIIDLGLAKSVAESGGLETQAGGFGGKLRYCSPEQAGLTEGGPDHRSDLYSFGLVLYEMLVGVGPFDVGPSSRSIVERFQQSPLPLSGRNPNVDVPPQLERVMQRVLAVRPDDRYPSATALMASLIKVRERLDHRPPAEVRQIPLEERQRILSNLDRDAKRIDESARLIGEADRAVKEGRFEQAREHIRRLEKLDPNVLGLAELKKRLGEAETRRRRLQVMQTEDLISQYLSGGQLDLGRMALETLLDLAPEHPSRHRYQARIDELAAVAEEERGKEELLQSGMQLVSEGDYESARHHLSQLEEEGNEGHASRLRERLETSEQAELDAAAAGEIKVQLEELLEGSLLEEAEKKIEELATLEVPKAVLDVYRGRLSEVRARMARESTAEIIEARYPQALAEGNWAEARELALQLEAAVPKTPRPGEMFAEITRHEEKARRKQAVTEGTAALETFLVEGRLEEAEVAWRVLSELAPKFPRRRKLERQLRSLRRRKKG